MKNFLIGFLLCSLCWTCTAAAFRGFGPAQTKALIKVLVAEFNRNRDWHSKPRLTADQVRDELEQATSEVSAGIATDPDLKWMVEENP